MVKNKASTDLMTRATLFAPEDSISANKCSCFGTALSKALYKGAIDRLDMLVLKLLSKFVFGLKRRVVQIYDICIAFSTPIYPFSAQMQLKIL